MSSAIGRDGFIDESHEGSPPQSRQGDREEAIDAAWCPECPSALV